MINYNKKIMLKINTYNFLNPINNNLILIEVMLFHLHFNFYIILIDLCL